MKQKDEYIVDEKVHNPRAVNLVCDATFYGKRKDKLGTLVFEVPLEGVKMSNPKRYSFGSILKVK